jgi:heme/copper-type cytochrome/quinol oxidase subunit 4
MKNIFFLGASLFTLPITMHAQGLNDLLGNTTSFISGTLIPFLFGMAFLVFVVNVIRFLVLQSSNKEGQENARNLLTYSVLAFVFLAIFWGVINIISGSIGLEGDTQPKSDYEDLNDGGSYTPPYCPPGSPGAC